MCVASVLTSGPTSVLTFGPTSGLTFGPTSGLTFVPTSGSTSDQISGPSFSRLVDGLTIWSESRICGLIIILFPV